MSMRRRLDPLHRVDKAFRDVASLCVCVTLLAAACGAPAATSQASASAASVAASPSSSRRTSGYELLARAVEHVTGASYASALRDELLDRWHLDRIIGQGPGHPTPRP
jgi:hypothetical protein